MNILSLFDGMSGGRIAAQRAGLNIDSYYSSEIDESAINVSKDNWPENIHLGDVQGVNYQILPKIDLLVAGSPCQGFSSSGEGLNFSDPRSALFFEFIAALKELKPKYFMLENVSMKKEWRDIISGLLGVEPIKINSSLVSAQNRSRYYWTNIPNVTIPEDKGIMLIDILEEDLESLAPVKEKSKRLRVGGRNSKLGDRHEWDSPYCTLVPRGNNPGGKRALNGKVPCVTASSWQHNVHVFDRLNKRRFTPVECERLQTVPDNYTASACDTSRFKMLGNGWTIDVVAHIFSFIPRSE